MKPKGAFRELAPLPPVERADAVAEVDCAGLALQRMRDLAGSITLCTIVQSFRHDCNDVSGLAVLPPPSNYQTDCALISFLL